MKFTQLPENVFQQIQLNAGILCEEFTPSTGTVTNIIGATSGGINFKATPSFKDFGEDIDNCPKNTKELKKLDSWDVTMTGNFVSITANSAKVLVGAGDLASTEITPRNDLSDTDFKDIWFVGDYSDKNSDTGGGFVAIKMSNALSTGGFQIQTTDKDKGKFAFEFTAHYSISDINIVPFSVHVKTGTEGA